MNKAQEDKIAVSNLLLENAVEALKAAVEIHNNPNISYKYPTVSILIINSWELAMKAFVIKNEGLASVKTDSEHTITLYQVMPKVESKIGQFFANTRSSIEILNKYRNDFEHFNLIEDFESVLYGIIAKNIDLLVSFIIRDCGFSDSFLEKFNVLPLSFKVAKSPFEILQIIKEEPKDEVVKSFVDMIFEGINQGAQILYNIDIKLQSVKKDEDLQVAINKDSPISVSLEKTYHLTDDKDAQKITLSDEELFAMYPHTYTSIIEKAREKYEFKNQSDIHKKIMKELKDSNKYTYHRKNHPMKKSGSDVFYSEVSLELFEKYCTKKQKENK